MPEAIRSVSKQIRLLFTDKGELCGINDWDILIGCLIVLEQIAHELETSTSKSEVVDDG